MAVYLVEGPNGKKIVEAKTKAGAINAVVKKEYKAKALSPMEAIIATQENIELITEDQKEAA
jgi:hypothetical protein